MLVAQPNPTCGRAM